MFELSGVHYEELLEQGDSILVRVIASSNYRGFELSGLYCIYIYDIYGVATIDLLGDAIHTHIATLNVNFTLRLSTHPPTFLIVKE